MNSEKLKLTEWWMREYRDVRPNCEEFSESGKLWKFLKKTEIRIFSSSLLCLSFTQWLINWNSLIPTRRLRIFQLPWHHKMHKNCVAMRCAEWWNSIFREIKRKQIFSIKLSFPFGIQIFACTNFAFITAQHSAKIEFSQFCKWKCVRVQQRTKFSKIQINFHQVKIHTLGNRHSLRTY